MFPGSVAAQLRNRGHDVVSVHDDAELEGTSDQELMLAAVSSGRAIVTENVQDCLPLQGAALASDRPCPVLIFTTNRQFPRANARTNGRLMAALDQLLAGRPMPSGSIFLKPRPTP